MRVRAWTAPECCGSIVRMTDALSMRVDQPQDGDERSITVGWLAFHRDALRAKCEGLTPEQLVARVADPSHLSLLGLVRHMAEMERAYGSWPLGDDPVFRWVWGAYEDDAEDDIDCAPADADVSLERWMDERRKTEVALKAWPDLGAPTRTQHSLRWNLAKLVGEYARHNGHADLIREGIDGQTGE